MEGTENTMTEQRTLRYFLGGNTSRGFYSLYNGFVPLSDGCFLWILKGTSGCGKSSFMRTIGERAEAAGLDVEYAYCSGDPASLDGVYIPALKTAYMDGTAPHVTDPHMAGVDSASIDLGAFCDYRAVGEYRHELRELYRAKAACYGKAYAISAAAGALRSGWQSGFSTPAEAEAAVRRVSGVAQREFGKRRKDRGRLSTRFLSALTCRGRSAFPETARTLCGRFYVLENRLQLAAPALNYLMQTALDAGHDVVFCPDPLLPERPEAVLLPGLSLGFVASDSPLAAVERPRHLRLDALADSARVRRTRPELRRCEKNCDTLLGEAALALSEAKRLHDRIEGIFVPTMNFSGIDAVVRRQLTALGL